MATRHDEYKRLDVPSGTRLEPCPVCSSEPELWQYSETENSPTSKVVMCSNSHQFGPQDGIANEGCLLYMPPDAFYQGRIAEAIKYWNEYARALEDQRNTRRRAAVDVPRSPLECGCHKVCGCG